LLPRTETVGKARWRLGALAHPTRSVADHPRLLSDWDTHVVIAEAYWLRPRQAAPMTRVVVAGHPPLGTMIRTADQRPHVAEADLVHGLPPQAVARIVGRAFRITVHNAVNQEAAVRGREVA